MKKIIPREKETGGEGERGGKGGSEREGQRERERCGREGEAERGGASERDRGRGREYIITKGSKISSPKPDIVCMTKRPKRKLIPSESVMSAGRLSDGIKEQFCDKITTSPITVQS